MHTTVSIRQYTLRRVEILFLSLISVPNVGELTGPTPERGDGLGLDLPH